ncbi:pentapeptide repeat-containing protein [Nocardia caishijiensis]|uniref:Pentapeptide repeat protein n=1 Tax=Nocardia caishijiensis TaxID=184756 RepID=A0ABQ6YLU0_9NOCA|nr:pentapeptide repeat-containing protein [Nocardia caishijiensis]KAF0846696.1 pentapeptide repeat protein [Nocardia caishijiensis]
MTTRPKLLILGLGSIAATVCLLYLIYQLPVWLAADQLQRLDDKDSLAAAAALRGQFVPVLALCVGAATVVYTAMKVQLDRSSKNIDRFNTAVTHLDSDKSVTRAGGAWAIQALMEDAPRERNRGRKLLAHMLREHATHQSADHLPGDIAVALGVLRSQPHPDKGSRAHEEPLDLTGIRVPGADLHEFYLPKARLTGADLSRTDLSRADLASAMLDHVDLIEANLTEATCHGANFRETRLNGADFTGADLSAGDFRGAALAEAKLTGANLKGADLRDAIGITPRQLSEAITDSTTQFPPSTG